MKNFIYLCGVTHMCLPGSHPIIRYSITDVHNLHYARYMLLQLSIEADITRGCFW